MGYKKKYKPYKASPKYPYLSSTRKSVKYEKELQRKRKSN